MVFIRDKEMEGRGIRKYGNPLRPPGDATTVRVRDGNVALTDGPFADTRKKMAAYELLECASREEALDVASRHPMAKVATVEVRPIWADLVRPTGRRPASSGAWLWYYNSFKPPRLSRTGRYLMIKSTTPTSPDGASIDVRPIRRNELGKVLIRCLPDGFRIEAMFKTQGVIGMGAWDGDKCIAQLHCYRLTLPHGSADNWPAWSRPSYIEDVLNGSLGIVGPVWCHACFHVGRSIESFSRSDAPDPRYFGRGIGTALCEASMRWAREHDYQAILAPGTPDGLFAFSVWAGGLPWTTYRRLGFSDAALDVGDDLPGWVKGNPPPAVMEAVEAALAAGRPKREFHSRLMVLGLRDA